VAEPTWTGFLGYVRHHPDAGVPANVLGRATGSFAGGRLKIECRNEPHLELLKNSNGGRDRLARLAAEYAGPETVLELTCRPSAPRRDLDDLRGEMREHPVVRKVADMFQAQFDVRHPRRPSPEEGANARKPDNGAD
jgi:DNA polymerase-3 subunit gamma/tau